MVLISPNVVLQKINSNGKSLFLNDAWRALNEQRKDPSQCDIMILCCSRSFHAHKNILGAVSPYFKALFSGKFKLTRKRVDKQMKDTTDLSDFSADCVQLLLDLIYLEDNFDPIEIDSFQMVRLLDFIQVSAFDEILVGLLRKDINLENCLSCLELTDGKLSGNIAAYVNILLGVNLMEVLKRGVYKDINKKTFITLLASPSISSYQPIDEVLFAIFAWLKDCPEECVPWFQNAFTRFLIRWDLSVLTSSHIARLCEECPKALLGPLLERWSRSDAGEGSNFKELLLIYSCVAPFNHLLIDTVNNQVCNSNFITSMKFNQDGLIGSDIKSRSFFLFRSRLHVVVIFKNGIFVIAYYDQLQEHFVEQYKTTIKALIGKDTSISACKSFYYNGRLVLALFNKAFIYYIVSMNFPLASSATFDTQVVDCGENAVFCRTGNMYSLVTNTHMFSQHYVSGEFVKSTLNPGAIDYTCSYNGKYYNVSSSGNSAWQISYHSNGKWIKLGDFRKTLNNALPPFCHNGKICFINRDKNGVGYLMYDVAKKEFAGHFNLDLPPGLIVSKMTMCTMPLPTSIVI